MRIPERAEAQELLQRLGVPAGDIEPILDDRPVEQSSIDVANTYACALIESMGTFGKLADWPHRDDFLYVWVFLSALPAVRNYHQAHGVADDVSWASLADLGRALGEVRWRTGRPGLGHVSWLTLHFRGALYRLGRLQFAFEEDGLGIHIPRDGGRLTPEACDLAFAHAREFFPTHFREAPAEIARCTSWLLDPQLAAYLGDNSNIVRFARRFELTEDLLPGDEDVIRFVFGEPRVPVEQLPQRTTMERAVVSHLSAGRHWFTRCGVVSL